MASCTALHPLSLSANSTEEQQVRSPALPADQARYISIGYRGQGELYFFLYIKIRSQGPPSESKHVKFESLLPHDSPDGIYDGVYHFPQK